MKKLIILFISLLFSSLQLFSQNEEIMFVPLKIAYFPGYDYRIPREEEFDKHTWINILTYHLAYPRAAMDLYSKNKVEYKKRNSKLLYTRMECDTFVRKYVEVYTQRRKDYFKYGEGAYYIQEKSGDRMYFRCVCIPAEELMDLGHGDAAVVGIPIKYIEPRDFVARFKRFKLDSLDLAEAPYYNIFPMDINPSFDCSKASTPIEKAICRDSVLASLDRKLSQVYRDAIKQKGEQIKMHQREWIIKRDKQCEGKNNEEITQILKELYTKRIEELKLDK